MLLVVGQNISRFLPMSQRGGAAGSQAGVSSGPSPRSASVKRSMPQLPGTMGTALSRLQNMRPHGAPNPSGPTVQGPQPSAPNFPPRTPTGGGVAGGLMGGSLRDNPERFGGQERGSATDAATALNRNSPGGGSPLTDPNAVSRFITPENSLRGQRIGFDAREIQPQSQEETFQRLVQSAMPGVQEQFDQQAQGIANRTSALGRTGSGMVDREFADLENQQERSLQGIMGSLAAQAAGQDVQNQMSAQGANQQLDMARLAHLRGERGFEDQLARQAMGDRANQLRFLQTGFGMDPTGALNAAAGTNLMGANEFGANAGMANQSLAGAAGAGAQQPGGIAGVIQQALGIGGPQLPSTPPLNRSRMNTTQVATPDFNPTQLIRGRR